MEMHCSPFVVVIGLLTLLPHNATAQAENGNWHVNGIDAPARLVESYWDGESESNRSSFNSEDYARDGEQFVDTFFPSPTDYTNAGITLNNGTITGAFPGTYSIGNLGKVSLSIDGEALTGYINVNSDTVTLSTVETDTLSLNIITRLPASLATADLAGTWKLIVYELPDDLTETYYHVINETDRQGKASSNYGGNNELLVDTFFENEPLQQTFTLTIDGAGNITGDLVGTATANGDKSVTFNVGNSVTLYPNAAVDVLTHATQETSLFTKMIAVKLPTSPAVADLEGVWRAQWLDFPTYLTETYFNTETKQKRTSTGPNSFAADGELLIDVYFIDRPELGTELISISAEGAVTGSFNGNITVSGNHFVFDPANPGDPNIIFYPNASGTVMTAADSNVHHVNLATLVKVANTEAPFEKLVDLKMTPQPGGTLSFSWNPASNFKIARSSSLFGTWQGIEETAGSSSYTVDTSEAPSMFYRIEAVDPVE